MAEITSSLVKTLREKSGAGMMDCKKALIETDGNIEAAIDWLRKKGLAAASKKAGRIASEGLIGTATALNKACIVEVNSETDFISRNADFQKFVKHVTTLILEHSPANNDALLSLPYETQEGHLVQDELVRLISVIGENMTVRRFKQIAVSQGTVASYIHNAVTPDAGRIGVLVALESAANPEALKDLGRKIAMHIAATSPIALRIEDVDASLLERERSILAEQARASGRPDNVIEKMIEGRIRKYYEEVVLLEQTFVVDGKTKVADVIEAASKELGTSVQLVAFERYLLGDGIEKEAVDFAAEVQAQASL